MGLAVLLLVPPRLWPGVDGRDHVRVPGNQGPSVEMPQFTDRSIEIAVFLGLLAILIILGFVASRWRRPPNMHSLEEWGVGGRAFGNWVTWFLIGGASYTAYTFIAVPSLTFGVGAFGYYAMPFALCTA